MRAAVLLQVTQQIAALHKVKAGSSSLGGTRVA
jgi:hypothetical protein